MVKGFYNSSHGNISMHTYETLGNCPTTFSDVLKQDWSQQDIFGFESIASLIKWFNLEALQESGHFKLSIYRVHKRYVKFGNHQIAFVKKKAKLESWIHLNRRPSNE